MSRTDDYLEYIGKLLDTGDGEQARRELDRLSTEEMNTSQEEIHRALQRRIDEGDWAVIYPQETFESIIVRMEDLTVPCPDCDHRDLKCRRCGGWARIVPPEHQEEYDRLRRRGDLLPR